MSESPFQKAYVATTSPLTVLSPGATTAVDARGVSGETYTVGETLLVTMVQGLGLCVLRSLA